MATDQIRTAISTDFAARLVVVEWASEIARYAAACGYATAAAAFLEAVAAADTHAGMLRILQESETSDGLLPIPPQINLTSDTDANVAKFHEGARRGLEGYVQELLNQFAADHKQSWVATHESLTLGAAHRLLYSWMYVFYSDTLLSPLAKAFRDINPASVQHPADWLALGAGAAYDMAADVNLDN